jgi:hypothetical protein
VLEVVFILLEPSSPSRRIFIGSHSLPPSLVRRIGPSTSIVLWPRCISVNKEVHDDIPLPLDHLNLCIKANAKAVDHLVRSLCDPEFERVRHLNLAWQIWEKLLVAHGGDNHVNARLFVSYRMQYENFTQLPS